MYLLFVRFVCQRTADLNSEERDRHTQVALEEVVEELEEEEEEKKEREEGGGWIVSEDTVARPYLTLPACSNSSNNEY